ncbi:MAG: 5'/3'-nucleotidase SurE, partial [Caldilineae bacterium]
MTNILITNDDGVNAPGIMALAKAMDALGAVTVIAPERNWSAAGHPKTLHKPLRLTPVTWPDGRTAYACSGAPSDCVALGLLGALDIHFDLVISGINSTFNLGTDVIYSGTVAGAMEALINGTPAIAVSLGRTADAPGGEESVEGPRARAATAEITAFLAEQVLAHGLPENTLLNVNVPRMAPDRLRGIQVTRLGRRIYRDVVDRRVDPWGRPYYWFGGEFPTGVPEDGSDIGAVENGYVSVTPLGIDFTNTSALRVLSSWPLQTWRPAGV